MRDGLDVSGDANEGLARTRRKESSTKGADAESDSDDDDAERETAVALVTPGCSAADASSAGAGSHLAPAHPGEFPARGRIARFVGAIGARQQACAATAMRSSSGATRRPP